MMDTIPRPNGGKVLIVGAGPVGLTAAALLTHYGVGCRVVDRSPHPTETSKALVLWQRTQELLDDLGIVDNFINAGMFVNAARLHGEGDVLALMPLIQTDTHFTRPLMLAQSETERLLIEHLGRVGVSIERSVELTGFVDQGDRVTASLRHGDHHVEEYTCDWLIGCDGAHSAVRKGLSLEFTGNAEPNDWVLADCRIDGPIALDEISLFWHSEGVLAVFPLASDRYRVIADMGFAKSVGRPDDPTLEEMQAIVDRRGPGGLLLSQPRWLSGFRIHERKVSDYHRGRVLLAGDSAHIHSPAGGQGMNTGMQDAYNLAWKLALVQSGRGLAKPLLDSYSIERGAVGEMVLRNATRLTTIATLRNPVGKFFRNRLVKLLGRLPAFRREFARNLSELGIHYPTSPLNGARGGTGIQPGDRLPDAPLKDAGNLTERRLLAVTHGPEHHLLLLSTGEASIANDDFMSLAMNTRSLYQGLIQVHLIVRGDTPPSNTEGIDHVWLDPAGATAAALGVNEAIAVLVRPDGYVGYRSANASCEALRNHLDGYLRPLPIGAPETV